MSSVLWLTFGINTGSVGTILNEILAQLVLIFVMYKLIREQQQEISIFKKISNMFKKAIPDVGRFIYIYDYIRIVRNDLKRKIDSTLESLRIFS
jgi:hypothetical protein